MNKLTAMVACCAMAWPLLGGESLVTNIYERVRQVYGSDKWRAPMDVFYAVRGGDGFEFGSVRDPFRELVSVVSNNFTAILQDWDAYATNVVVAFTVANAAAYSGEEVLVPFADEALSLYERTKATNDWRIAKYLFLPNLTPQNHFMALNYDKPAVNALLVRFRACAKARDDKPGLEDWCDEVLSGEAKKYYLELKAAGVEF